MNSDRPQPRPEPLGGDADYGLSELGPDHLSLDAVLRRFGAERSWWVATTRPDGRPHAMPVWGLFIEHRLVFSTDPQSVKADNLTSNQAIVVHLDSGDQVAVVEGTARRLTPTDIPAGFSAQYEAKYGFAFDPADPAVGMFEVVPAKVFSWDEANFAETAARWRFT